MKEKLEAIGCAVEESSVTWLKVEYQGYLFYLRPILSAKSNKYFRGARILTYHEDGRIHGWSWNNREEFEALLKLVLGN